MKKILALVIICTMFVLVFAKSNKNVDDMLFEDVQSSESISAHDSTSFEDIIKVNFEKKDARKAMLFSMLIPGAGQYYADKGVWGTYVFPVIEVGLIGGILYYNSRGNDKTDEYEKYANGETITQQFGDYTYTGPRYNRNYQASVENVLINVNVNDIYDDDYFRLDALDSQHFYEDIGKYNKYIYGWSDWYYAFATDATGNLVLGTDGYDDVWSWSNNDPQLVHERHLLGNARISEYDTGTYEYISPDSPAASPMRAKYIAMRRDAEKEYSKASLMTVFIAFNHILSAVDAVRVTNNKNRYFLSDNNIKFNYYADLRNSRFTPMLGMNWTF